MPPGPPYSVGHVAEFHRIPDSPAFQPAPSGGKLGDETGSSKSRKYKIATEFNIIH
jgi:hypothetical protein